LSTKIKEAEVFASLAHFGQVRKYTGDPYIVHPFAVAEIVKDHGFDEDAIIAALLHDVVEDCEVEYSEIHERFGLKVAELVFFLTDPPKSETGGNRAERKAMTIKRFETAPAVAHSIKVADILHNSESIGEFDPDFSKVFFGEVTRLLDSLHRADPRLMKIARERIRHFKAIRS
jgi:(p)ppGpp synthase/HD superfamily hydrolase